MLERAPACLEQAGRRLFTAPHRPWRSRYALHSTFWSHGAGDIDLPSWWMELLQHPPPPTSTPSQNIAGSTKERHFTRPADDGFLSFLYPSQTLAWMHKITARNARHMRTQAKTWMAQSSRLYSSGISEYQMDEDLYPAIGEKTRAHSTSRFEAGQDQRISAAVDEMGKPAIGQRDARSLRSMRDQIDRFQERLTGNLESPIQRADLTEESTKRLAEMVKAALEEHSKYVLSLINHRASAPDTRSFAAKLKAYYHLNRFQSVLDLYNETLDRHQDHETTPAILRLALDFEDWLLAVRAYGHYKSSLQDESYFWKEIAKVESLALMNKTFAVAEYVWMRLRDFPDDRHAENWREFGVKFVEIALSQTVDNSRARIPPSLFGSILKKLQDLISPNRIKHEHYQLVLRKVLDNATGNAVHMHESAATAVQIYRAMRKQDEVIPDQALLEDLVDLACRTNHWASRTIYDHLKELYGIPALDCIQTLLADLEYRGDVTKFTSVIHDAQRQHQTGWTLETLAQVLRMYAKRRQVQNAQSTFDSIHSLTKERPAAAHWDALVAAYASEDDISTAHQRIESMTASGISPSAATYQPLFECHARRGDTDAIDRLVEKFEALDWPLQSFVYRAYVRAHIENLQLEEAETTLLGTLELEFEGPRGPMWGDLVREYAKMRMRDEMNALLQKMSDAGIPESKEVYQGMIIMHAWDRKPFRALDVIKRCMPEAGITPIAYDFALVMQSLVSVGLRRKLPSTRRYMLNRGIEPELSVKTVLLRAAARADVRMHGANWGKPPEEILLTNAEKMLLKLLESADRKDMALEPLMGIGNKTYEEAFSSNFFVVLLLMYGQKGAWSRASTLYDLYIRRCKELAPDQSVNPPPMKVIGFLMKASRHTGDYEEVARGWSLALGKAKLLASRAGADLSGSDWVLPSRRSILSIPLTEYMSALFELRRFGAVEQLLHDVQSMGFALDSRNWNAYVQGYAMYGDAHTAFRVAEQQLIAGWDSWPRHYHLKTRHFIGILDWREPREHEVLRHVPSYKTMVLLARAYVNLRERWLVEDRREDGLRELLQIAPVTVEQVSLMPRRNDRFQRSYLLNR